MPWSKYRATKVQTEDGTFDSKREYKRWLELKEMEKAGQIHELHRQIPFDLLPSQYADDGRLIERKTRYVSDFTYITSDGYLVVEDAKGCKTPEYILKRKMMLYFHDIEIKEV